MLAELAVMCKTRANGSWKNAVVPAAQWGLTLVMTLVVIILIWARGSILSAYKSHFAEHSLPGMASPKIFRSSLNFSKTMLNVSLLRWQESF